MSCIKCEEIADKRMVAYYRVDKANVGLIGCDEHLNKVMRVLDGRGNDRPIVRVKEELEVVVAVDINSKENPHGQL
jgi:hypothetical protein